MMKRVPKPKDRMQKKCKANGNAKDKVFWRKQKDNGSCCNCIIYRLDGLKRHLIRKLIRCQNACSRKL